MRNTQLLTNAGFLVSLTAEANMVASDSGEVVEVVMVEPVQNFILPSLTTLGNKENPIKSFFHELTQGVEDTRHCRRPQIRVVHSVDDDAANIDAKCFCIQRSVLCCYPRELILFYYKKLFDVNLLNLFKF